MNTPAPTGNTPLLLKELDIPGRSPQPISTNPIVWGINWAAALGNFPLLGLLCRAGPWSTMNVGDRLVVNWGPGQQVVNKTIDKDEVDKTLTLFVPPGRLLDGPFKVSYVVTRLGQVAEPSEVMDVLVKLTIPGGQDTDPGPGHSNFFMFLPKGTVENGIDKDNVADGVDITIGPDPASGRPYLNAAAGDVVLVSWGGVFVPGPPLTQDQADGKATIIIHVDEATIREAGDSDGVAVAFEVHDKVFNRSEDWSHEQRVPVAIDTTRPAAPLLKQAISNVLDLDKLGNADGIAQVMILDNRIAVGDIITVRVKGATTEGVPIDEKMPAEPVVSVPSILEIDIPNALLRRMAKSQLILSYAVQKRDGAPDLQARSQFISVIGEARRLLAPKAIEANQGALDPDLAQVRVEIPFDDSFAAGQVIVLFWLGTRPDLSIYLPDLPQHPITQGEVDAKLPIVIIVPGSHLRPINGGTLVLYYQLLSEDQKLRTMNPFHALHAVRESLRAAPLQIGEPLQELPPPKVDGVVNGVLPADTPGTHLNMLYTQTVADDVVYRQWLGSKTGADSDWVKLTSLTAGKAVAFTIRPELIKGNEGGTVKASYHLERKNGRVSYSQVEAFNVGPQLDLKPPSIKEAPNDTNLDPFEAAKTLTAMVSYTGMQLADKITVTWAGTATPTGSHTTAPVTVTKLGTQEILLPEWLPVFNLGKAVTVSYSVVQGSSAAKPSQPRPLTVMPIANEEPRLPKPIILSAPNQGEGPELDVTTLTAPVNVRLYVWPHIYGQQRVWLHLAGRTNSGADYNKVIWNAAQVSGSWVSTGYADAALLLAELRALANNSTLTITFKATFDRDINENQAVTFPLRRYTIKNVADLKPAITRAEDSKGTEIAQGAVTVDAIVKLIGTATESQKVEVFDGTTSKGQATANAAGLWELRMTALSVAAHIFRARALYGSNLESDAKTLTVTALIVPTLVEVLDTAGVDIVNGGITTSTRLKLSGKASNAQRVEVFDGSGPSAVSIGIATTSAAGDWEISVPVLEGAHRFAAQSLYHPAPTYSNVRTLTVTGLIQPTLEYVRDTAGADIVDGAITISTTLKLSGKASNGQKVEIFDGNGPSAVSRGIATASAGTGDWELSVSVLEGAHRFAAQSLYHPAPTYSNVRTLTVTGLIQPTLEYVRDVAGADIDEGASTIDTTMKLSGKASKGQRVEIFDGYGTGAVSKGIATASPATGDWEIVITVETGARRLYGLSLYHLTLTYSNVRTLTVAALIVPVLEAVLDATDISIPDNGTTTSTTLKLSGKATNGQRVEVFDGDGPSAVSKGIVTANTATGDWQHVITVPEGARRLYAKSLYHGADVYSNVRYLTVVAMGTPIHENFDALAEVNLTAGVSITTANMVISCLEASGINKIKNTELSLQNIKGKVMDLNSMGRVRVRFELKGVYSEISFWHVMNMTSSNNTKIELYDLNAQLVSSTLIPAAQGWERQSTFNGTKFSRVEIVMASDWLVIDNIRISP